MVAILPNPVESLSPNLSERCKEVVRMRFVQSMTQDEIADELGITQQMVCKYLSRARREHPNLPRLLTKSSPDAAAPAQRS